MRLELQSILQRLEESIDSYLGRIKDLRDKLAVLSIILDDDDIILYTISGLIEADQMQPQISGLN